MPLITQDEYVDIDGVPLATPAWLAYDFSSLWDGPDVRGDDLILPGAIGGRARRRRATISQRIVNLAIFGDYDQEGVYHGADYREQLWANVSYLRTNVVDPVNSGDGTRVLTVHLPDGGLLMGDVHVIGPMNLIPMGRLSMDATLTVSIPGGMLELVGS